jgi:hypothetical protein
LAIDWLLFGPDHSCEELLMDGKAARRRVAFTIALMLMVSTLLFAQTSQEKEARDIFQKLISVAGVSFHEVKVREEIQKLLPASAKPTVDAMGNLIVTLGSGKPQILFIAHMDEIGLEVADINADGTIKTVGRGGFFSTV